MSARRLAVLTGILLFAAALSWAAREVCSVRFNYPELHTPGGAVQTLTSHAASEWFSPDPDGLYHARRLARALEEGLPPAETDPLFNAPAGAPIPWPPYYTYVLYALLQPFLPEDAVARQAAIERAVATLPHYFGVLAALLSALAAWFLAGAIAALGASAVHALCYGAIHYSTPGVGDHHAFVSLLASAFLLALSLALRSGALERPRAAAAWGALCGALAGLMLGTWVTSLWYVLIAQLTLGLLLFRYARRASAGLAPFGLALHLAAALVLLPAVISSPWRQQFPWMVVNLSWFHLAFLLLGAVVFVPMPLLAPWSRLRRNYPWLVASGLAALAAVFLVLDVGPAAGVREGFAWASRAEAFMATIAESEPLVGPDRTGSGGLFVWVGYGALLLPLVWIWGLRSVWRRESELPLLPWLVAAPLFLAAALAQRRFSDGLAAPMAVLLGWGVAQALGQPLLRSRVQGWPAGAVTLVAALALHAPALARCRERWNGRTEFRQSPEVFRQGGWRMLIEWLALYAEGERRGTVLASWDLGHGIEWVAGLPTVATNYGSYVGVEGFQTPARFFLARDPAAAEALLTRRGVRYVLAHSGLADNLEALQREAGLPEARWRGSLAESLLPVGADFHPGEESPLRFLRLLHVPPLLDPAASPRFGAGARVPCGWIWERVPGAQLEAVAPALSVDLQIEFPSGRTYRYRDSAAAGPDGIARLRLPWATSERNGEGAVTSATWSTGAGSHPLVVSEEAVASGSRLELQ